MLQLHRFFLIAAFWMTLTLPSSIPVAAQTTLNLPPEVRALLNAGNAARESGQTEEALRHYEEALEKARTLGDKVGEAWTWSEIAHLQQSKGELEKALESFQKTLTLMTGLGNDLVEGNTLANIGWVYHFMGRSKEAKEHLERALTLVRAAKNRRSEGAALGKLAIVYRRTGEPRQALKLQLQTLPIWKAVSYTHLTLPTKRIV